MSLSEVTSNGFRSPDRGLPVTHMSDSLHNMVKYLNRHAHARPLLGGTLPTGLRAAVVIPALAEFRSLPETMASLDACRGDLAARTAVVVVVNNSPPGINPEEEHRRGAAVADNRRTLEWLASRERCAPRLHLAWIDAATPGNELPPQSGVGMARKIGCDSILRHVYRSDSPGQTTPAPDAFRIFHLDADTTVEPNYLDAVADGMSRSACHAAAVAYAHRMPADARRRNAMAGYELFLRHYAEGLAKAGSPYAFHAIGSAMACTAAAYCTVRGVPRRRTAGEDFYFMQNLAKTGGVCTIGGTTVHPSARLSSRTPFGTGARLRRLLADGHPGLTVFAVQAFEALRDLFRRIRQQTTADTEQLLLLLASPAAADFLRQQRFEHVWPKLRAQHAGANVFPAFHRWFDALATLRFLRWISAHEAPEVPLRTGWRQLRPELDADPEAGLIDLLDTVRNEQQTWPVAGLA